MVSSPAGTSCSIALSSQRPAPLTTLHRSAWTPSSDLRTCPWSWRPGCAASSWASPSTLMPSMGRFLSWATSSTCSARRTTRSGGSRETGTKVLAARPSRVPWTSAAMATTPEGKWPKASRSVDGVRFLSSSPEFIRPFEPRTGFLFPTLPAPISVRRSHIGVRAQPALPGVAAVDGEDRIRRVDHPAGARQQPAGRSSTCGRACRQRRGRSGGRTLPGEWPPADPPQAGRACAHIHHGQGGDASHSSTSVLSSAQVGASASAPNRLVN